MLQNPKILNKVLFGLEIDNKGGIKVMLPLNNFGEVPLEDLENISEKCNDNKKVFNYFLSMTMLLSDLCMDRNCLAINILKNRYSFEACFLIIRGHYNNRI